MMKNKNRYRAVIKGKIRFSLSHFFIFSFFILLAACSDYESFSDNPNFRLSFSADTIAFDTLISTIPSSTKTLYAFNKNNDGIRISTIRLEGGASSHFRVNVDGRYLAGGAWNDFEVLGGDSLVVRIEMTPPEVGSNEPLYFTDKLHFFLENGAQQTVVLSGGALDAYIKKGGLIIESDETLLTDKPYVIYDSLVVKDRATLTLTEGTTLMFHDKAALHVYGKLQVQGSIEKPVVLRGDRMDHMFDNLPYDNTPSRWEGIIIHRGSYGNTLYQCDLHSSCFGIICEDTEQQVLDETRLSVTLDGCILHHIGGDGLQLNNCACSVTNTEISNTLGHTVKINGGSHTFVYCTIAQFYYFATDLSKIGSALHLVSSTDQTEYGKIRKAHFINCVITGYGSNIFSGENIPEDCNYLFHHCFINTPPEDSEHYVACIFDQVKKSGEEEKLVRQDNFTVVDTKDYLYDFTPKAESKIRSLADPAYEGLPVFDRKGVNRLADEGPDAGCYEYVAPAEEGATQ